MSIVAEVQRAHQLRRLLSLQLRPAEVQVIIDVFRTEENGGIYRAGKLGFAESLVRRDWLVRSPDGSLHLSERTKKIVAGVKP